MLKKIKSIDGWVEGRFKDFAVLQRGKDLTDNDVIKGPYPVVKSNGVDIYHNQFLVEPDGVVTGRSGTIGKVFFINERFWAHNTTLYVKDFKGNYPKFIFYLIQSMNFEQHYAGTTVPTLNRNDIHRLKVNIPESVEEQAFIAAILTKVDDAITATESSIRAAEKLKQALMQNLLTGKLRPDGSWRTEEEFFVDEKFGRVPLGWEVKMVGELTDRKNIAFDPQKSSVRKDYIGLEHVAPNEFRRVGLGASDETLSLKSEFAKGDLLYGKLRPYLNKVWLSDLDGVCSTEFLVLAANSFTNWIYLNFQTGRFRNYTLSMTAGTQHPRAGWKDIKRFPIYLPQDETERTSIQSKILFLEESFESKRNKILTLQRLKKSLMQNLLTGKVRVAADQLTSLLAEPA